MQRPIEVMGEGLGHPEGPDMLPDGRVVFVETYTSDVKVWEEGRGISVYGYCGGGTNACIVGSDGDVYVTQNGGTVGAWRAADMVTPSIQRIRPDGTVEHVCTLPEGHVPDGFKLDAEGNYWICVFMAGGLDVIAPDGTYLDFLECPHVPLNCCFDGTDMWVTEFGDVTEVTAEAPMIGRLLRVDLGVQGMEPFRGSIA